MSYKLSQTSLDRLKGVHPKLVAVVKRAIEITKVDFKVVEGVRSDEQCYTNFGKGRTAAQCEAVGCPTKYAQPKLAKVTWVRHPLSSNHRVKPDGLGHAVDLLPEPYDWKDTKPFDELAVAMYQAAEDVGVHIRWGADWDEDGKPRERGETDSPHFEIAV